MHLIFSFNTLPAKLLPDLPKRILLFETMETLTVGPLISWDTPSQFWKARQKYWSSTPVHDTPDGEKWEPEPWFQTNPQLHRYFDELMEKGPPFKKDWPFSEPVPIEEAIPQAKTIEVWKGGATHETLGLWRLIEDMFHLRADQPEISVRALPDRLHRLNDAKLWHQLVLEPKNCPYPATLLSLKEQKEMRELGRIAAGSQQDWPDGWQENPVFSVLNGRRPDPESGLTNIQIRLLRSVRRDWLKMVRVVGDAMGMGWDHLDDVKDGVLVMELKEMAKLDPPLVEVEGKGSMRYCRVRLTEHGRTLKTGFGPA